MSSGPWKRQKGVRAVGWVGLAELAAQVLDAGPMTAAAFTSAVRRLFKQQGISAYMHDAVNAIAEGEGKWYYFSGGRWHKS